MAAPRQPRLNLLCLHPAFPELLGSLGPRNVLHTRYATAGWYVSFPQHALVPGLVSSLPHLPLDTFLLRPA